MQPVLEIFKMAGFFPDRPRMLRINCAPSWLYLQDYTEMHGQQNIKVRGQSGGSEENYEKFLS